jgi:dihydrodipicolinate synthase/N-acetylneuraminate lyase
VLKGALAAAATPLRDGGAKLDEAAFPPLVEFFADNGLDGVFALGTTGEGLLLTLEERRRAAELFIEACAGRLTVVVHCGAQTTADSVALAEHAAGAGVDAIAAVAPPYYPFDEEELTRHFAAVAAACAPTPFFLYEIAARSGYAIPLTVVERLRDAFPNLAGLKVSDTPFDRVEPYLLEGLDVFVGSEPLAAKALARGAAGVVSGLATAFPEIVASLVNEPTDEAAARIALLRDSLQRFPFIAALKAVLGKRGVAVRADVRAPLRTLTEAELDELGDPVAKWLVSS